MRLSTIVDLEIFAQKLQMANIDLPENMVIEITEEEITEITKYWGDGATIFKLENLTYQTAFGILKIKVV